MLPNVTARLPYAGRFCKLMTLLFLLNNHMHAIVKSAAYLAKKRQGNMQNAGEKRYIAISGEQNNLEWHKYVTVIQSTISVMR